MTTRNRAQMLKSSAIFGVVGVICLGIAVILFGVIWWDGIIWTLPLSVKKLVLVVFVGTTSMGLSAFMLGFVFNFFGR